MSFRAAALRVSPSVARSARGARRCVVSAAAAALSGVQVVSGLGELAAQYDLFILDQYGVLHNGGELLPGVGAALGQLHAAGKQLVVLSNTSKRRDVLVAELPGRGFEAAWLTDAVCSGEECHEALRTEFAGKRAVLFGWMRDADDDAYLSGTDVSLAPVDTADVLVALGPDLILDGERRTPTGFQTSGDVTPYAATLDRAAERGLPMLCANPDQLTVSLDRSLLYMPGGLADAYRARGGVVVEYGKPGAAHFRKAVAIAAAAHTGDAPLRVLHVGDSLKHDIAGAANAQIDSLFVADSGVHADELAADDAWRTGNDPRLAVERLCASLATPLPTFCVAKFRW